MSVWSERPVIDPDTGPVRGRSDGQVSSFLGIPFAEPPVGPLRFRPPRPAARQEALREADAYGERCVQPPLLATGTFDYTRAVGAEDCLTLNVWTPNPSPGERLPVMFFIHGGGFLVGSSSEGYDGTLLARDGRVVLVTANYRVGALGFMAHPALAAESEEGASGNNGHLDQVEALRWVQRNIALFGGDPSRVTIFGQSAGGSSVLALVASPLAGGLFAAAIPHSGGAYTIRRPEAEARGTTVATALGCTGTGADAAACLRALPAADFVARAPISFAAGTGSVTFAPVVDGHFLPEPMFERFQNGEAADVPMLVGHTAYEFGNLAQVFFPVPLTTEAEYRAALAAFYPGAEDALLAAYPLADYASPRDAMIHIFGDGIYVCPARKVLRALAPWHTSGVRRWIFSDVFDVGPIAELGAAHGNELTFLFGEGDGRLAMPTAEERAMGGMLLRYWTRFAATGDPNGGGDPVWPRYDPAADGYLDIATPPRLATRFRTPQCDFWDPILDASL